MVLTSDTDFMQHALYLAQRGAGFVAPNPMVGAVLVHEGRIIGEGWHQQYGHAHAEVNCINNVQADDIGLISKSAIYVSLEPCAHYGKTPPCAELIIEHKIPKVVIACIDTFSEVAGKGVAMLEAAGIEVVVGICEEEARDLNKRFFTFHEKKRPFIILKWAQSADGFIAPERGRKVMLSNALTQRYVHKMRQQEAAILIGYETALLDDPMLTDRYFGGPQPLRLVVDPKNALPTHLHLKTDDGQTIIFNLEVDKQEQNCRYVRLNNDANLTEQILEYLHQSGINSLIVEGGSKTLNTFIQRGLWDEAHIIKTHKILTTGTAAPEFPAIKQTSSLNLGDDTVQIFQNR